MSTVSGKGIRKNTELNKTLLVFNVEYSGAPINIDAPVTDLDNWPRIIALSFFYYDGIGRPLTCGNFIIQPINFEISDNNISNPSINQEIALHHGIELKKALRIFHELLQKSYYVVSHNLSINEKIIGAELLRAGMGYSLYGKNPICLMESMIDFCALEENGILRKPTLSELYYSLFEYFATYNNSPIDYVQALARCFWEIKKRDMI